MRIAVKYCGGCNPSYQRSYIIEKLRRDFPGMIFGKAGLGTHHADLVLVLCGCSSACADHKEFNGRYGKMVACRMDDYGRLSGLLAKMRELRHD
jgi:hypothetical protein